MDEQDVDAEARRKLVSERPVTPDGQAPAQNDNETTPCLLEGNV